MTKEKATAKKPQLVHTARQMFETQLAKYNDPRNLEWDFNDITDKWERHAWSAFLDLQSTEAERNALLSEASQLREALLSLFCCECGKKFTKADEWDECATHKRIRAMAIKET